MEHPKFVTAPALAEICNWPAPYRRRVARHIRLTDSDGNTCDYKDEFSFWEDLLVYLEGGQEVYQQLLAEKLHEKTTDKGKEIIEKCLTNIVARDRRVVGFALEQGNKGFVEQLVWKACDFGLVEPAAFFLWSFWLSRGVADVNAIIDGNERLIACFGSWRAPDPEFVSAAAAERQEVAALAQDAVKLCAKGGEAQLSPSGASVAAVVVAGAVPRQTLFDRLCAEVDEATGTPSPEPALRAARTSIDALLEDIERQARADAARSGFEAALTALRQRPAPLDPGAAARRAIALDRLAQAPPVLPAATVAAALEGVAHDIHDRIRQADEARRDFERAAEQHGAARFNRDILRAYEEAIARYEEAETALTQAVEKLAAVAASDTHGGPATGVSGGEAGCNTS